MCVFRNCLTRTHVFILTLVQTHMRLFRDGLKRRFGYFEMGLNKYVHTLKWFKHTHMSICTVSAFNFTVYFDSTAVYIYIYRQTVPVSI